jgi:predicted metal-dependent phosphotriesterase family hydrolase
MITRHVLPYLRQLGLPDGQINALLVDNPRRFFGR